VVKELEWAQKAERPPGMPIGRPRGAKAVGVRYEKALAKALPGMVHGQWWNFRDRNGNGYCQTDFVLDREDFALVLEAKYTWVLAGHTQLRDLYIPVVGRALAKPVFGIVVCRNLIPGMPDVVRVTDSQTEAARLASQREYVVLHWSRLGGMGA